MDELEQEILELTKTYFEHMDEDISDSFLLALVKSVTDHYKTLRNYPESYTDEMIEQDVARYFSLRKSYIAFEIIPELYGRLGGEGLSMLTDAGTTRIWKNSVVLHDVVPICEVV